MNTATESIAAKIRALLAKTTESGATEDEALAAIEKAQELMDKYSISLSSTELKAETMSESGRPVSGRHDKLITDFLAFHIAKYTNTKSWYQSDCGKKTLKTVGTMGDVEYARWLTESLITFIHNGATQASRQGFEKRSFILGCAMRIADRLKRLCQERDAHASQAPHTGMSLMIITKQQMISAWLNDKGLKFRSSSTGARSPRDGASFGAGQAYGDRAGFGRPVSGPSATLRLGR